MVLLRVVVLRAVGALCCGPHGQATIRCRGHPRCDAGLRQRQQRSDFGDRLLARSRLQGRPRVCKRSLRESCTCTYGARGSRSGRGTTTRCCSSFRGASVWCLLRAGSRLQGRPALRERAMCESEDCATRLASHARDGRFVQTRGASRPRSRRAASLLHLRRQCGD